MRQDVILREGAVRGVAPKQSPVKALLQLGQSPWLAHIKRSHLTGGELERMMTDWGLRGVTTSASMFEDAIARTHDYDGDIAGLAREGLSAEGIYDSIVVRDVQHAADLLRPVFDAADGGDGLVTVDIAPRRAADAGETIAEAKRLWAMLRRPNVMICVPATEEGITATRALLAEGVNVGVTLLFSIGQYNGAMSAYLEGLEAAAAAGRDLARISSVAAFFLSRIDTAVDGRLDALAAVGDRRGRIAGALRGQAGVATARRAYTAFEELTASPRFRRLADRGAHPQRPMWTSIGSDDSSHGDTRYVEALIGAQTIASMPVETLRAFHDHGRAARVDGRSDADAAATLEQLGKVGVSLDQVAGDLLRTGLDQSLRAFDSLIEILEIARQSALGPTEGSRRRRRRDGR
ncbi:MAG: transaldolase [Gammaproteobacteria bacterium]|nr:transaldolase [Gammaproteobacteria bacterium]